jgi:hypothetical protein
LKLYFKNSQGKERLIVECETLEEIHEAISDFLDEHNFKCYYTRSWEQDGRIKIDVGSHTEFFFIDGITYEDYLKKLYDGADDAYYESQQPEEKYHQITMDEYLESLQKDGE